MFNINHILSKEPNGNKYNIFRLLEPEPTGTNNNNNNNPDEYLAVIVNNDNGNSNGKSNNESGNLDGITTYDLTKEASRQLLMDKFHGEEEIYSGWNKLGILPSPMRLVMFRPSMCQLCGVTDERVEHTQFYTGYIYEHSGYNYCCKCKDKFCSILKARAEPIWELLELEENGMKDFWGPRTRRDPVTNERIYTGRYNYEKWRAVSRFVSYSDDNTKIGPVVENTPFIFCETTHDVMGIITKLISVSDLLKSNYNACKRGYFDMSYDPNDDDPINTLELSADAKISLTSFKNDD